MKFLHYDDFVLNEDLQKNIDKILSSDRTFLLLAVYDLCENKKWKISSKNNVVINHDKVTIPIEVDKGVCFYTLDDKNKITYTGTRGKLHGMSALSDRVEWVADRIQAVFDNLDKYTNFCFDYRTFYFPVHDWTYKFKDFNSLYGYVKYDSPVKIKVGDSIQMETSLGSNLGFSPSHLTVTCIKGYIDNFFYMNSSKTDIDEISFYSLSGIESLVEKKLGSDMALKLSHIPVDSKRTQNCKVISSDPKIYNHSPLRAAALVDIINIIPDTEKMKKKLLKDFSDIELHKYRGKLHGTTFGL